MHRSLSANTIRNIPLTSDPRPATNGSRYSSRNTSRTILVPFHNVNICPTVLHKKDYQRVKTASKYYSKEDRQRELDKLEADQQRQQYECNRRKAFLQYIDEIRKEKQPAEAFEMKDPKEDERILSRVFWTKHEQV